MMPKTTYDLTLRAVPLVWTTRWFVAGVIVSWVRGRVRRYGVTVTLVWRHAW